MPKTKSFDKNSYEYDNWFEENYNIFESELNAIKSFIPKGLNGIEIGVGTGKFASALNIDIGIEPSQKMAEIARSRGIKVLAGVAENLPIEEAQFDFAMMVTAICFFDNIKKAFTEANRIIKDNGFLIVAFIDKDSKLGTLYQRNKQSSKFYSNATFYSVNEIKEFLTATGFKNIEYRQTIYSLENTLHTVNEGYGQGSFVVIKAVK